MKINKKLAISILLTLVVVIMFNRLFALSYNSAIVDSSAPEFTHTQQHEWINSPPLTLDDLKGKVVLLDFWTYGCWNCYRSFPWLNALEDKLHGQDFIVIGVHTPEFAHEKKLDNIKKKVKEFNLRHPIMVDSDHSYWNAMGNRYWPSFYLIDKQGKVDRVFIGETHTGDKRAVKIAKRIQALLKNP